MWEKENELETFYLFVFVTTAYVRLRRSWRSFAYEIKCTLKYDCKNFALNKIREILNKK